MKRIIGLVAVALALLFAPLAPAIAAPLSYVNSPLDTPQALVNSAISEINTNQPESNVFNTCSGTTTATCLGLRFQVSITGLTTADAGALSAAMTVTDTAVTAASQILCQVNGYAGTGVPTDVNVIPGAGSFALQIQNTSASAALNATVASECLVFN